MSDYSIDKDLPVIRSIIEKGALNNARFLLATVEAQAAVCEERRQQLWAATYEVAAIGAERDHFREAFEAASQQSMATSAERDEARATVEAQAARIAFLEKLVMDVGRAIDDGPPAKASERVQRLVFSEMAHALLPENQ